MSNFEINYTREYYHRVTKKNPARMAMRRAGYRKHYFRTRYGLSVNEAEDLKKKGCSICGNKTSRLDIDHCHRTGRVRGALCVSCNTMLAGLENPSFREKAESYLRGDEDYAI